MAKLTVKKSRGQQVLENLKRKSKETPETPEDLGNLWRGSVTNEAIDEVVHLLVYFVDFRISYHPTLRFYSFVSCFH